MSGVGQGDAARRSLSEDDIVGIVVKEIDDREAAAVDYERLGQPERAGEVRDEAAVLRRHVAR